MTAEPRLTRPAAAPAAADGIEGRAVDAPSRASPATASPRPPSTTSPAKPAAPGPPSTATSRGKRDARLRAVASRGGARPRRASADRRRRRPRRSRTPSSRSSSPRPRGSREHAALQFLSPTSPSCSCRTSPSTAATASSPTAAAAWRPRSHRSSAPSRADARGEWLARIVLSYVSQLHRPHSSTSPTTTAVARAGRDFVAPRSRPPPSIPTTQGVTPMAVTNHELIGRDDVNDLEAILSITQHRRRRDRARGRVERATRSSPGTTSAAGRRSVKLYEKAKTSQWNVATDLDWSTDVDPEKVVLANAARHDTTASAPSIDLADTPFENWGDKEWIEVGIESQNWPLSQFLHGEQGALICTARDRRDRPVDRRQVLRGDAGDGRGPPRRGVRQVPRREAVGPLPDQRAPEVAARRHPRRQPLGHDLPRHADHGRGPRARRLRVHAPDHDRAAAEEAAALRDERRGAPRRVRRALAAGVLQGARRRRRSASARSSRSRPRCACATGSCSTRCGSAWASTSRRP